MAKSRARLTLGGHIEGRRRQLGLTQTAAARQAGVSRKTWRNWESDLKTPYDSNHRIIEEFCEWQPGSVAAVLEGRAPTLLRIASVTPIRPGLAHAALDDALVTELEDMGLPPEYISTLVATFWAETAHADTQRVNRFLDHAREAGG
jgi:DNA-binding XRE family transcriptional regulator